MHAPWRHSWPVPDAEILHVRSRPSRLCFRLRRSFHGARPSPRCPPRCQAQRALSTVSLRALVPGSGPRWPAHGAWIQQRCFFSHGQGHLQPGCSLARSLARKRPHTSQPTVSFVVYSRWCSRLIPFTFSLVLHQQSFVFFSFRFVIRSNLNFSYTRSESFVSFDLHSRYT